MSLRTLYNKVVKLGNKHHSAYNELMQALYKKFGDDSFEDNANETILEDSLNGIGGGDDFDGWIKMYEEGIQKDE